MKSSQLQTAHCEAENIEDIVPLFIRSNDLCVRIRFGIVEILSINVLLGTSLMDLCIHGIFSTKRKIFALHMRPVTIILMKRVIYLINADNKISNVYNNTQNDASNVEFNLCLVACQVAIPVNSNMAVLVSCHGAGLMIIDTHGSVFERRCFMTAQVLMGILPVKPFYVYIENLTARPGNLPNLMIVSYAFSAPTLTVHAKDDKLFMLTYMGRVLTQSDKSNSDRTINAVR